MNQFLGTLKVGDRRRIVAVKENEISTRLLEMGFIVGEIVEVIHEAPLGDPIAVNVRGTLLALRRNEANLIEVTHV